MNVLDAQPRPVWDDTVTKVSVGRSSAPRIDEADVVVVGAGFTGLWTAYHLLRHRPGRRIVILDAVTVGVGASGRNGGWCSAETAASPMRIARRHGEAAGVAAHEAMVDTVGAIGRVIHDEGIDAGWAQGGSLHVARNEPQALRLRTDLVAARRLGVTESVWLDADEARQRVAATGVLGGVFDPHGAVIQPAALVHGLAGVVERMGATIHEHSPVVRIEPGAAVGRSFRITAPVVIRSTEAGTGSIRGQRRTLAPVHSLMIATEPLGAAVWDQLRWERRETFNDARRLVIYAQRTADDRIAFGGRGAPYHFGSRLRAEFQFDDRVHQALADTLIELFPILRDVGITHRWGGALGIARDWWPSMGFDRVTGLGWASGYVGDGVAATHLAGRTLAALVDQVDDPVTRLPWVGHRSRRWEPEPLRWPGITAALWLTAAADASESRTGRPSKRGALVDRLTGG